MLNKHYMYYEFKILIVLAFRKRKKMFSSKNEKWNNSTVLTSLVFFLFGSSKIARYRKNKVIGTNI